MANRWSDVLRFIGRSLDAEEAQSVRIRGGDALDVAWQQKDGATRNSSYGQLDMNRLREQAPLMRRAVVAPTKGEREELLRTLGQELDEQNVTILNVVERPGSYEVRCTGDGGVLDRFYSVAELRELSEKRRALRGTGATETEPAR